MENMLFCSLKHMRVGGAKNSTAASQQGCYTCDGSTFFFLEMMHCPFLIQLMVVCSKTVCSLVFMSCVVSVSNNNGWNKKFYYDYFSYNIIKMYHVSISFFVYVLSLSLSLALTLSL